MLSCSCGSHSRHDYWEAASSLEGGREVGETREGGKGQGKGRERGMVKLGREGDGEKGIVRINA